jgi:dynein heavy chain
MIVGPAGGGKTTCYKVLKNSLNDLCETDNSVKREIKTKVLNPKSISMGELYG